MRKLHLPDSPKSLSTPFLSPMFLLSLSFWMTHISVNCSDWTTLVVDERYSLQCRRHAGRSNATNKSSFLFVYPSSVVVAVDVNIAQAARGCRKRESSKESNIMVAGVMKGQLTAMELCRIGNKHDDKKKKDRSTFNPHYFYDGGFL